MFIVMAVLFAGEKCAYIVEDGGTIFRNIGSRPRYDEKIIHYRRRVENNNEQIIKTIITIAYRFNRRGLSPDK